MRSIALTVIDAADDTHEHHQVDRRVLLKRGLRLEYISLGWNLIEGAVAIVAGVILNFTKKDSTGYFNNE